MNLYQLSNIVIEIIYHHIFNGTRPPFHKSIRSLFELEQYFQYRNDKGKREKRQDRRQNIEKDIEGKVIFIGGHKSPEYGKKIFHASHIEPGQNRAVYGCKDNTNTKIAETGA